MRSSDSTSSSSVEAREGRWPAPPPPGKEQRSSEQSLGHEHLEVGVALECAAKALISAIMPVQSRGIPASPDLKEGQMQRTRWTNGPHQLEFQEPDILIVHQAATLTVEEVDEAIRIMKEEVTPEFGPPFYFMHMVSGLSSSNLPKLIKHYSTIKFPWKALVIIGAPPALRVALNVSVRTMALLGNDFPVWMVDTFEEAYAWANAQRAREAKAAGG